MNDAQRSRVTSGLGVLFVALGLLFLVQQILGLSWNATWPYFIIAVGLVFFAGVVVGGRPAGPLAIPGAVITMIGLILLYQSAFDRYQTWAYAWTLLLVAGDVGALIDAAWRNRPERARLGRTAIGVGVALFVVGFFFEFALNFSGLTDQLPPGLGGRAVGVLGALALIALGAYLLIRRGGIRSSAEGDESH